MNGLEFEHEVAAYLRGAGYTNVETTKGSGDFGIDVLAKKDGFSYAFQCKYYSGQVGVSAIQEAHSGKAFYDCDFAVVVTSSEVTRAAQEMADKLGVEIWDRIVLDRGNFYSKTEQQREPRKLCNVVSSKKNPLVDEAVIGSSCSWNSGKVDFRVFIGDNANGDAVGLNLFQSGHVLVGGSQMSKIDNLMHTIVLQLMYCHSPENLRLILIDSRMLELGLYNGIPNLYVPVVTDSQKAVGSLMWAQAEVQKRYRLFAETGCRDITSYNKYITSKGAPPVPAAVIVISDLGDLLKKNDIYEAIQGLLNGGSKAGIILVAFIRNATSAKQLKQLRSGFHTLICYQTTSPAESKMIIDSGSAAKLQENELLVYGGLYADDHFLLGYDIDDNYIQDCVIFKKVYGSAAYLIDIFEETYNLDANSLASLEKPSISIQGSKTEYDELLPKAVEAIFETKQASTSMIQRRLKLGYSSAARLVDQMEELGVVGPFEGSRPRRILITQDEWEKMKGNIGE